MTATSAARLEEIRREIAIARAESGRSYWVMVADELLAEVHRRGPVVETVDTEWDEYPRVKLPQDPWRQLYPIAVCPDCAAYVHSEAIHRKSHE